MEYNKHLYITLILSIILLACFVFPTTAETIYVNTPSSVFLPGNPDEFVPIDDGTKIIESDIFLDLYFWRAKLSLFLNRIFYDNPYRKFVQTNLLPFLSIFIGCLTCLILSIRKKPDYNDPTSTTSKILSFLEGHQIATKSSIAKGIEKSRGSVSYQLHRLTTDLKIHTAKIHGKTYYSLAKYSPDDLITSINLLKNSKQAYAIIIYICKHPYVTRKEIMDNLSISINSLRYNLKIIDSRIIVCERHGGIEKYTIEERAKQILEEGL